MAKKEKTINAIAIKKYRMAKGWTVAELAEKLKSSRQVVYNYENGTQVPPARKLVKIAKILGVEPLKLLDEKE